MSAPQVLVGIDVAKAQLDMALRPTGERWTVTNDEPGITTLVTCLQQIAPQFIGLEATGGYQRAVVAALAVVALPIVVVNLRQVRDVAKATGQLAKTDVLNARAVAHFIAGRKTNYLTTRLCIVACIRVIPVASWRCRARKSRACAASSSVVSQF